MANVGLELDRPAKGPPQPVPSTDEPARLPRIVLKDGMGRVLDTDTSYQRTINEGRLKIAKGDVPLESGEWRLPHAPVPFRPDYSRIRPPVKERMGLKEIRRLKASMDSGVFCRDSNSLSAEDQREEGTVKYRYIQVRDSRTMGLLGFEGSILEQVEKQQLQTTYLPFTLSVPAGGGKTKNDQETLPNLGEYVFPGFCNGCQRMNALVFCYGCERDPNPHYHQDKTGRTGGGFTYIKRDRPLYELANKNPLNWRTMLTNVPYIFYDGLLVPSLDKYGVAMNVEGLDKRRIRFHPGQFPAGYPSMSFSPRDSTLLPPDQLSIAYPHSMDMNGTPIYIDDDDMEEEEELEERSSKDAVSRRSGSDSGRGGTVLDGQESAERRKRGIDESYENQTDAGEEEEEEETEDKSQSDKKKLYQAPKVFQLKKRDPKPTIAASPFSTNRQLNIPKYKGIDIQKSDKKPTGFIDMKHGDSSWNAPDAFKLKDRDESPEKDLRFGSKGDGEDQSKDRKSTTDAGLTSLLANKQSDGTGDRKKSLNVDMPHLKAKLSRKGGRLSSADSGVGSINQSPATPAQAKSSPVSEDIVSSAHATPSPPRTASVLLPVAEKVEEEGPLDEKVTAISPLDEKVTAISPLSAEINSPVKERIIKEGKQRQQRIRSSAGGKTKGDGTTSNDDQTSLQDEEGNEADLKGNKKTKEVAMKEKARDPKRAGKKSSIDGEDDQRDTDTPRPSEGSRSSEPEEDEPMIFREHSIPEIDRTPTLPEPLPLPRADPPYPPKMMEFFEPAKPGREISTTEVEVPPPMVEPPRQRPPPPVIKEKRQSRRSVRPAWRRPVGAPVLIAEVKNIVDPLDWLAKYCIIHPDRLPVYMRTFGKATSQQFYRYSDVPHPDADDTTHKDIGQTTPESGKTEEQEQQQQHEQEQQQQQQQQQQETSSILKVQKTRLTDEEKQRLHDLNTVSMVLKPEYTMTGKNEGDQTIDKINYTLDVLIDKYEQLQEKLDILTASKVKLLVDLTRQHFPDLTKPDYDPTPKKKKKGKKETKDSSKLPDRWHVKPAERVQFSEPEQAEQSAEEPQPFGDLDIIGRLKEKHLSTFSSNPELGRLNLELTRLKEKLKDMDDRIDDLEDEKKLLQLYARDDFIQSQTERAKPEKFLRKQSPLYQKMHPTMSVEMNLNELEEALKQINGHLITQKELQYIFFILNIPGRRRIDVQLFSVIAALSEKVAQVEPFVRKLINKFDFEALNIKMERSKELFGLLTEENADVPFGKIAAKMLGVELAAGGVSKEHTEYVLGKFNRDRKGIVDFLDFLTYIPLFIEIHNRILDSPLGLERSW